jgi:hypothetical protein
MRIDWIGSPYEDTVGILVVGPNLHRDSCTNRANFGDQRGNKADVGIVTYHVWTAQSIRQEGCREKGGSWTCAVYRRYRVGAKLFLYLCQFRCDLV